MKAPRRFARAAPAPAPLWHQIVDEFPAPIAVVCEDGRVLATNRALRHVMDEDHADGRIEQRLAPAIRCAFSSPVTVMCCCPIVPGFTFVCRNVDDDRGLVALIGRASQN